MRTADQWVAGLLTGGIVLILASILVLANLTRIPVSHVFVDPAGAHRVQAAGHPILSVPGWPNTYRVNAVATQAAYTSTATLFFARGSKVRLPRKDIRLWVYRG